MHYYTFSFIGSKSPKTEDKKIEKKEQSTTLQKLEQQYESSRYLTHIARGVGLGFASSSDNSS